MVESLALLFVVLSTVVGALGTILFKKGVGGISFFQIWKRGVVWGALGLYVISAMFYLLALRKEMVTVIYPLASLSYVWVVLFSVVLLHEKVTFGKIVGVCGIVLGVVLIGLGS